MFVSKCGCNEISLRPLFYFVLPSPTQRMSKYIKEIGVDDAGVHIARKVDVSDSAAIDAALVVFEFSNQLASSDLGRPGKSSCRQHRFNSVQSVFIFTNLAPYRRADVHNMRKRSIECSVST